MSSLLQILKKIPKKFKFGLVFLFLFFFLFWLHISGNYAFIVTHSDQTAVSIVNEYNTHYPGRYGVRAGLDFSGSNRKDSEATAWAASSTYDIKMTYDPASSLGMGKIHYTLIDRKYNQEIPMIDVYDYRNFGSLDKNGDPRNIQIQKTYIYDDAALLVTSDTAKNAALYRTVQNSSIEEQIHAMNQFSDTAIYYNYACAKGKIINLPKGFRTYGYAPNIVGRYVIFSNLTHALVHDMVSGKEKQYRLAYLSQLAGIAYQKEKLYYRLYPDGLFTPDTGGAMSLPFYDANDFSCADLEVLSGI